MFWKKNVLLFYGKGVEVIHFGRIELYRKPGRRFSRGTCDFGVVYRRTKAQKKVLHSLRNLIFVTTTDERFGDFTLYSYPAKTT